MGLFQRPHRCFYFDLLRDSKLFTSLSPCFPLRSASSITLSSSFTPSSPATSINPLLRWQHANCTPTPLWCKKKILLFSQYNCTETEQKLSNSAVLAYAYSLSGNGQFENQNPATPHNRSRIHPGRFVIIPSTPSSSSSIALLSLSTVQTYSFWPASNTAWAKVSVIIP